PLAVVVLRRLLFVCLVDAVFTNDFTRKNYTPTLSLVTFLVTGSGNISRACLVTGSIRGALLGYSFVGDFYS
ncbi:MAG: hypothetical protein OEZ48_14660, partial [Candidatus Bathyarchaeota archaeon]|nr:hypothetical protein [Candidatus Bathyarchaeota archaeon]